MPGDAHQEEGPVPLDAFSSARFPGHQQKKRGAFAPLKITCQSAVSVNQGQSGLNAPISRPTMSTTAVGEPNKVV